MKKLLLIMLTLAVFAAAGELNCEDLLRTADNAGAKILPKTFDAIVENPDNWQCQDTDDGEMYAISKLSHHILSVVGQKTTDRFVDFVNGQEKEILVEYDNGKRKTEFLAFGSIEDLMMAMLD